MRIASFNIRNGRALDGLRSWPFRRRSTASAVVDLDVDILGLQEAYDFQLRWLLRHVAGYTAHGEGRDGGRRGERCPLLVRNGALRVLEVRTRWFGDRPERPGTRLPGASAPRIATIGELELVSTGRQIQIVNTHLDERVPANRLRSAEQLAQWIDQTVPVIVLGDLNAPPGDPVVATLESAGLRSAFPPDAGATAHGFTGRLDGSQIDHILVSHHWSVSSAGVARPSGTTGTFPSDHWPVVADLLLT